MICCVVGTFMVIAVILTVPVGIFRIRQVSHNGSEALEKTVDLTEEIVVKQSFVPQADYIKAISVDIDRKNGEVSEGVMHFILRNKGNKVIVSREYSLTTVPDGGFFEIPVNRAVKAGETYTWEVYMTDLGDCAPCLYCTAKVIVSPVENRKMFILDEESESTAVTMYIYGRRQGKVANLTYVSFILWAGISLVAFVKKREK